MMFLLPENVTAWLCPKPPPAVPADVRKAFGLPARLSSRFWATPNLLGRSPRFIVSRSGSAERFRTSGGIAAGVNHFLGKANQYHPLERGSKRRGKPSSIHPLTRMVLISWQRSTPRLQT